MIIRPKIKICGIKDLVIANLSIKLGADYLGFVCYDQSIRNIWGYHRIFM